jgi:serine protease Do
MSERVVDGLFGRDLAAVAERLRAVTVHVRGRGRAAGSGSGVVWRPGVVVTNAHVATGRSLVVETPDGVLREAELAASDQRRDLAVLRVATDGLPSAALGTWGALRVGALVVAVGNPLGLSGAVTTGIVHALPAPRRGASLILADLRLFPGNSGGPLGDATGQVVGVNAMILRGLAAAIPSDAVERFLERVRLAA